MHPPLSLTVVIPALNEEKNLEAAVNTVRAVVPRHFPQWEILIFNDGSTDRTGAVAERLALFDENIRVFHHPTPRNLGACYRAGIRAAAHEYLILVPGDNEFAATGLARVLAEAGVADIIVPYVVNSAVRSLPRRMLSRLFSTLVSSVSGCSVRYYNGTVLHRTRLLKTCGFKTDGFGYQAEILVKLIRAGCSYQEVGVEIAARQNGKSKAFSARNILQVARLLRGLITQA